MMQPEDIENIRRKCDRFRILVIGKANAGKTTILQKVCNTTDEPKISDPSGRKMSLSVVLPSKHRGQHEIEKELIFASNPGFVFHDSRGFEAGSKQELERVKKFIAKKSKETNLAKRLHAVWYCIPTDNNRILLEDETSFFELCDTSQVPVIAIFTKFDYRHVDAFEKLLEEGQGRQLAKDMAPTRAQHDFEQIYVQRLYNRTYPPRKHVFLYDMNTSKSSCDNLIQATAETLNDASLRLLFISTQQNCIELCVEFAIRHILAHQTLHSLFGLKMEVMKDIVYNCVIWFPRDTIVCSSNI